MSLNLAAGFYICWGCLVWVPSVYTSPGMYLVNHPVNLGTQVPSLSCLSCCFVVVIYTAEFSLFLIYFSNFNVFHFFFEISFLVFQLALFILVAGIMCIYINYDCDRQRQEFRRTNGKSLVWGKAPSKVKMHRIYWVTIFHLECTFYFLYNASQIGNLIVVRLA